MRVTDIVEGAANALIARYVKRAIIVALGGGFAIVALYYLSAAGSLALALAYGPLSAYLIMAGIYTVAALIAFAVFYSMCHRAIARQNLTGEAAGLLSSPRNMQIAMLVEAVMLGYTLARKSTDKSGNKGII